jgi:hypothetical protein
LTAPGADDRRRLLNGGQKVQRAWFASAARNAARGIRPRTRASQTSPAPRACRPTNGAFDGLHLRRGAGLSPWDESGRSARRGCGNLQPPVRADRRRDRDQHRVARGGRGSREQMRQERPQTQFRQVRDGRSQCDGTSRQGCARAHRTRRSPTRRALRSVRRPDCARYRLAHREASRQVHADAAGAHALHPGFVLTASDCSL